MSRYDTEWLQGETVVSLWDRISRQFRDQCQRHLRGYLACIPRRTFETLRTLIAGRWLASQNLPILQRQQPAKKRTYAMRRAARPISFLRNVGSCYSEELQTL